MHTYEIITDGTYLVLKQDGIEFRKIKKTHFLIDLFEIKKRLLQPQFLTDFADFEKKAIHRYFIQALARMDLSSKKLFLKAKVLGFDETLVLEVIENFKDKGYINDTNFEKKEKQKKLKKGFSLKFCQYAEEDGKEIEENALKKLIQKKKKQLLSSDIKEQNKAYRFFIMRGFSMNRIKELLNQE